MPIEVIEKSFYNLKKAAALANLNLGQLDEKRAKTITQACDEIWEGKFDDNFSLVVWQTDSGAQTNINLNEVIVFRANQIIGEKNSPSQ